VVSFVPWPLYPQGKGPWYPLAEVKVTSDRYLQQQEPTEQVTAKATVYDMLAAA